MDPTQLITAVDTWLASLHPHMADVSSVQLLSVLIISWFGCRAICGTRSDDEDPPPPREITRAEVEEILRRARRRR
jgi:hypothetical protein